MTLGYLISPVVQIVDSHGKPVVGAKIYVYEAGTTNQVTTYNDFEQHYNASPVLTDTLGNCTIIASDEILYDIAVYDNRNRFMMSKDNLSITSGVNPDLNLRFISGEGIIVTKSGNVVTISIDEDLIATKDDLATKQDTLHAGANIEITPENVVNVVNRKTLYAQWPVKIDRGSTMVKVYLDQDFIDNAGIPIIAGTDLSSYLNSSNQQVIGVNTNGTVSGDYNFIAGYNTQINGNHNIVAGAGNIAVGNRNAVFGYNNTANEYSNFVDGTSNSVSGSSNIVAGQNNTANGTANTVFGVGNSITDNTVSCNTIIGQYATQGDYYFAIGDGDQSNRSNVFEVRKNDDIYFKYNDEMVQLTPSNKILQYNVSIPNDGTTVTIRENTNIDNFIIEGKYNTTNSNYEIIIRNTNSVSRYIKVFNIANTGTVISNGNNSVITTAGLYNSVRERLEIFGMGVGSEKPRGEYTIYTDPYTTKLEVTLYEIQPYSL